MKNFQQKKFSRQIFFFPPKIAISIHSINISTSANILSASEIILTARVSNLLYWVNLRFYGLECLSSYFADYQNSFLFYMLTPFMLMVVIGLIYLLFRLFQKASSLSLEKKEKPSDVINEEDYDTDQLIESRTFKFQPNIFHGLLKVSLFCMYFLLFTVCNQIFSVFSCFQDDYTQQ